jgi:hypothetical protein
MVATLAMTAGGFFVERVMLGDKSKTAALVNEVASGAGTSAGTGAGATPSSNTGSTGTTDTRYAGMDAQAATFLTALDTYNAGKKSLEDMTPDPTD